MPVRTIGIGAGSDAGKVFSSVAACDTTSRVVVYTVPGTDFSAEYPGIEVEEHPDPAGALVDDLISGSIGAAVRGTLPANTTLAALKRACGVDRLERAVLLETASGDRFFLAPVGIDEGWSVEGKVALATRAQGMAEKFGLPTRIGILSGGRIGDIGRHPRVDRSLAEGELVARLTGGIHYEILIEDAASECGVLIAPDGISGNLIFRTLTFLGKGTSHGAPVLNIGTIFIDTSRATRRYTNAIRLADCLLK
ncbi:MAG TPA: methanogenesis marker protein Mmp4/MtxX [Methanoregulaceae archaeon]|jgi:putative methanogen marker protein 4|nr:methanogenesis marker protein Mmp4/MtxX [Methanoregulaceae archaeon]